VRIAHRDFLVPLRHCCLSRSQRALIERSFYAQVDTILLLFAFFLFLCKTNEIKPENAALFVYIKQRQARLLLICTSSKSGKILLWRTSFTPSPFPGFEWRPIILNVIFGSSPLLFHLWLITLRSALFSCVRWFFPPLPFEDPWSPFSSTLSRLWGYPPGATSFLWCTGNGPCASLLLLWRRTSRTDHMIIFAAHVDTATFYFAFFPRLDMKTFPHFLFADRVLVWEFWSTKTCLDVFLFCGRLLLPSLITTALFFFVIVCEATTCFRADLSVILGKQIWAKETNIKRLLLPHFHQWAPPQRRPM
jgi:hypothetical protein